MNNVNQVILDEEAFFSFHESLKESGGYILRCFEISGKPGGKQYQLIYIN